MADYSVLVVDDEESIRRLLQKELAAPHRRLVTAETAAEALALCRKESFEVIILDIRLGNDNALPILPQFLQQLPDAKIIMVTGHADVDTAVTAMKNGAYDFVPKPFTLDKLELIVERAFEHTCLARENRMFRLATGAADPGLIGSSAPLRHISYLLEKVAPTDVPVLITGESGTGKDVVAAAIHRTSKRAALPFVVKNCAELQKELARSEMFGHVKGAFTNALESREGLMTVAHKGTLFLDEIGELPLEVQGQLLRVLENQSYRRVGEKEERRADVRFLFATNRNLAHEVQEGRFHEALFHRINVFQIPLPTLYERREDIPLLVRHFLQKLSGERGKFTITPEAMQRLMLYHWPGNVRELRNVIERGTILAENNVISEQSLPQEVLLIGTSAHNRGQAPAQKNITVTEGARAARERDLGMKAVQNISVAAQGEPVHTEALRLNAVLQCHIQQVLALCGGNKQKTAQTLGISRKTLYRKMHQLGILE